MMHQEREREREALHHASQQGLIREPSVASHHLMPVQLAKVWIKRWKQYVRRHGAQGRLLLVRATRNNFRLAISFAC